MDFKIYYKINIIFHSKFYNEYDGKCYFTFEFTNVIRNYSRKIDEVTPSKEIENK